jgi:hypothetical protein
MRCSRKMLCCIENERPIEKEKRESHRKEKNKEAVSIIT